VFNFLDAIAFEASRDPARWFGQSRGKNNSQVLSMETLSLVMEDVGRTRWTFVLDLTP